MKKFSLHTLGYLGIAILLMLSSSMLYDSEFINAGSPADLEGFRKVLHKKEARTIELLNQLEQQSKTRGFTWTFQEHFEDYRTLFKDEGIILLGYENDSLKYWSDNMVPVNNILTHDLFHSRSMRLDNGFYEVIHHPTEKRQYYGLILIKTHYNFENDYLINDFQSDFKVPASTKFALEEGSDLPEVRSADGVYLFSLKFRKNGDPSQWRYYLVVLLFVTGAMCLLLFLMKMTQWLRPRIGAIWAVLSLVIIVLGLRAWSLWEFYPLVFSDLDLFNPAYYGTSFLFPSLGDMLINALLFLFLAWAIRKYWHPRFKTLPPRKWVQAVLGILAPSLIYAYSGFLTGLLRGLIKDSSINFEVNNLFGLDWYSYVGILVIGLLFLSAFILCNKAIEVFVRSGMRRRKFYIYFVLVTAAAITINHVIGRRDLILVLWPAFLLLILAWVHYRREGQYEFTSALLVLFLLSFASSHTVSKYSQQKERENRQVFAEKLTSDEDPVAEYEYPELERKLVSTAWVQEPFDIIESIDSLVAPDSLPGFDKEAYDKRIKNKFFDGYWDKYEVTVHLYDADSLRVGVPTNARTRRYREVESLIRKYGTPSDLSHNLYYIHNSGEKLSYLIEIPLRRNGTLTGTIVFELASKLIPEELGFPALLLSKNSREIQDLSNYSSARYVDKRLIVSSGDYHYPLTLDIFESINSEGPFHNFDDYNHLFFQADEQTFIILSKPRGAILNEITAFSYLFAFFSILLVLVLFFRNFPDGLRIDSLQLKTKVQFLLVSVLLLSLILFVMGTRYYIEEQYQEKNDNLISEKINSVQIEVSGKVEKEKIKKSELATKMPKFLKKFSGVFFTDINLYSLNGTLLASSREKIFDEGLISRQINPEAWLQIGLHKRSKFIHEEEIGNMRYLSAYVPFRNSDNEILAYLNLPYFARQDELESEISAFLVAIINIFVLLFGFSIVVALFASNWITQPLRQIQQSLAKIELGKSNKPIDYTGNDEIGSLVAEYNRKVIELQRNAELLARSERETAWREMAKQVAHEIKNPLTPIKLRAQHMQMSFDPEAEDAEERIRQFTDMLIEQIDTLTGIANEFSNFAKMPKAQEEKIDLMHLLQSSVELYKDVDEAVVSFASNLAGPEYIMADRDQMTRVFSNLIKNATQAIPSDQEGKVEVILTVDRNGYRIEIKDNGTGIPEEVIERIFTPNFTTKSTGMGLGLAMVKQIVENHTGKVWFKTKRDVGTSFYVSLPVFDEGA